MLLRIALVIPTVSGAFYFIAWWMEENGAAHDWNPAWRIIVPIKFAVVYLWLFLFVSALLFGVAYLVLRVYSVIEERKLEKQIHEAHLRRRLQMNDEIARGEVVARERKEAEEVRKLRLKAEHEARIKRRIEEKRNRTSEDAKNAALDEF